MDEPPFSLTLGQVGSTAVLVFHSVTRKVKSGCVHLTDNEIC